MTFFSSKLKSNPIKCTCKLKSDLSDESIKSKIVDLKYIRCTNLNKTVEEAIKDANCGMICSFVLKPNGLGFAQPSILHQPNWFQKAFSTLLKTPNCYLASFAFYIQCLIFQFVNYLFRPSLGLGS